MYATLDFYYSFPTQTMTTQKIRENFEDVPPVLSFASFRAMCATTTTTTTKNRPFLFRMGPYPLEALPPPFHRVMRNAAEMMPCTQIYLHDTVDGLAFLTEHYPHLLSAYHALRPGAYKSDLVRLCLLETYGGVYADMSLTFLHPFTLPATDLVLVNDINFRKDNKGVGITNGFMASNAPNHPLIHAMIQHIHANIVNRVYNDSSLDVTGPIALRKCWETFFGQPMLDKGTQGEYTAYHAGTAVSMFWMDFQQRQPYNLIENQGKPILQVKFDGYQDLMYTQLQTKPYWHMWNERDIYVV